MYTRKPETHLRPRARAAHDAPPSGTRMARPRSLGAREGRPGASEWISEQAHNLLGVALDGVVLERAHARLRVVLHRHLRRQWKRTPSARNEKQHAAMRLRGARPAHAAAHNGWKGRKSLLCDCLGAVRARRCRATASGGAEARRGARPRATPRRSDRRRCLAWGRRGERPVPPGVDASVAGEGSCAAKVRTCASCP